MAFFVGLDVKALFDVGAVELDYCALERLAVRADHISLDIGGLREAGGGEQEQWRDRNEFAERSELRLRHALKDLQHSRLGEIPCTAYYKARIDQKRLNALGGSAFQKPPGLAVAAGAGQVAQSLAGFGARQVTHRAARDQGNHLIQIGDRFLVVSHQLVGGRTLEIIGLIRSDFHRPVEILQRLLLAAGLAKRHPAQIVGQCEPGIARERLPAVGDRRLDSPAALSEPWPGPRRPRRCRAEAGHRGKVLDRRLRTRQGHVRPAPQDVGIRQIALQRQRVIECQDRLSVAAGFEKPPALLQGSLRVERIYGAPVDPKPG